MYEVEGSSWQSRAPTWRGMAPHEETRVGAEERIGGGRAMESSREPFMAPSGQGPGGNIGACRVTGGNVILGILLLYFVVAGCGRVEQRSMERAGDQRTSRHNPVSMEDSREGCHCSRHRGWSDGGSSKEHAFNTLLMEEANDQGEA